MKRLGTWLACAVAALGLSLAAGCASPNKRETTPVNPCGGGGGDNPCGDNPCGENPCAEAGGDGALPEGDANDEEGEEEPEP